MEFTKTVTKTEDVKFKIKPFEETFFLIGPILSNGKHRVDVSEWEYKTDTSIGGSSSEFDLMEDSTNIGEKCKEAYDDLVKNVKAWAEDAGN
jgi:hypothetical protein